jgi:putative ABC transport system substrate-binding protein
MNQRRTPLIHAAPRGPAPRRRELKNSRDRFFKRFPAWLRSPRVAGRAVVLAVLCASGWSAAAADVLAIVPDVKEPYRSVLTQIVDGMRSSASVRLLQLSAEQGGSQAALSVEGERVAIALGSTAAQVAQPIRAQLPLFVGAIVTPSGQPPLPGLSLETDPARLFERLTELRPTIRTVHWLFRPERSGWMLDHATAAARKNNLTLAAVAVDNARDAAKRYQELLARVDSKTDAVWLSQDPALIANDSTLPDILGNAWARNIVVFSGSVQHVAHGALFALYPDNAAMGRRLVRMALAHAGGVATGFEPNREVRSAINRRTAEHLGISPALDRYEVVLPAR